MVCYVSTDQCHHPVSAGEEPGKRICAGEVDFKMVKCRKVTQRAAVVDTATLGDMSLYSSGISRSSTNPEAKMAATDMPQTYDPADV